MPRTHAWTRVQRCLLIASVATGLAAFALLVYGYERYYRGPSQEALVGVWECTAGCLSEHFYLRFDPTHNVEAWSQEGEMKASYRGRWYAGGNFLYLRFIGDDILQRHPITIWRIDDLTTTEMRLRSSDISHTMTRITSGSPPNASNQAIQLTAPRLVSPLRVATTFNVWPRALSGAVADLLSR